MSRRTRRKTRTACKMCRERAARSAPAAVPSTGINLASLPRAPVQEATTPPQGNRRRTQTFWGHLSVGYTRASEDGGLMPSRFPTVSVTASISDAERRKSQNVQLAHQVLAGWMRRTSLCKRATMLDTSAALASLSCRTTSWNFLCDGKEFRDLSYCSNKKYLAGLPPREY